MNTNSKKVDTKIDKTIRNKILFAALKYLLIFLILVLVLFFATSPLRGKAANNYVAKGDQFLLQKKYISAELEYTKALKINPNNAIAKDHKNLADKAAKNIGEFERFFDLPQFADLRQKFEATTRVPKSEKEAVMLSRKLIEDGEYQLAIIPAATATEMDQEYKDAWLYLGIANLKTAEFVELKPEIRDRYLNKAKDYFGRTLKLDPENKYAKDFLDQANKT